MVHQGLLTKPQSRRKTIGLGPEALGWVFIVALKIVRPRATLHAGPPEGLSWAASFLTLNCLSGRDSSAPMTLITTYESHTDLWAQLSPADTKPYTLHKLNCS